MFDALFEFFADLQNQWAQQNIDIDSYTCLHFNSVLRSRLQRIRSMSSQGIESRGEESVCMTGAQTGCSKRKLETRHIRDD